jgi:predicted small lipoprotein YifL
MRYWVCGCVGFYVLLGLAGCGQKGDLYLPDTPPKAEAKKVPPEVALPQ